MVLRHEPASFPDEQSTMWYAFNCLRGVALGQILPHVREDGEIGLEDLPAFIQLLEAAIGDPDRVATTNGKCGKLNKTTMSFLSTMLSSKLLLQIWIGILRHYGMLYEWDYPKKCRTPLHIAICQKDFLRL